MIPFSYQYYIYIYILFVHIHLKFIIDCAVNCRFKFDKLVFLNTPSAKDIECDRSKVWKRCSCRAAMILRQQLSFHMSWP